MTDFNEVPINTIIPVWCVSLSLGKKSVLMRHKKKNLTNPRNKSEESKECWRQLSSTHILAICRLGREGVWTSTMPGGQPLPLSPSLNTHTVHHSPSTQPPPLLPQAVQSMETHTNTQREGCRTGPSALLCCGYQGVLAASPLISHHQSLTLAVFLSPHSLSSLLCRTQNIAQS